MPRPYALPGAHDHPPFRYDAYRSTRARAPERPLLPLRQGVEERTGPGPALAGLRPEDADLTTNAGTGQPALGARTIVTGRVRDATGAPVPGCLLEIWQANAAGRYAHPADDNTGAPLDPNFLGAGRCLTGPDGTYRFVTVRPGPYPWGNHENAWRPAHIHLSLYGPALVTRLVTQLYFPGDPLLDHDPIFQAVPEAARGRLVSTLDLDATVPSHAVAYRFDVVLRGEEDAP